MPIVEDITELEQLQQSPHKTCISRVRITEEVRIVLPAADYLRKVQVFVPELVSKIFLDEDRPVEPNPDGGAPAGYAGRNRVYKLPELDTDLQIKFRLYPGQWLVGATAQGTAELTFIVSPVE
jgi:hypothetical protein